METIDKKEKSKDSTLTCLVTLVFYILVAIVVCLCIQEYKEQKAYVYKNNQEIKDQLKIIIDNLESFKKTGKSKG